MIMNENVRSVKLLRNALIEVSMRKNTFMKNLLLHNLTDFTGKIFLFQPENGTRYIYFSPRPEFERTLMDEYPGIVCEASNAKLGDIRIRLREFIPDAENSGILHTETLDTLQLNYPWYFERVYVEAQKAGFFIPNTFVYESPGYHETPWLPRDIQSLASKIRSGEILLETFEKCYEIEGFAKCLEHYIKGMTTRDSIPALWNWVHQKELTSTFQKFAARHLVEYVKINDKTED